MSNQQIKLIKLATSLLGKPYKYGAKPEAAPSEFDCSSFTQYLYKQLDIDLPRSALLQASEGEVVEVKHDNLRAGDLLFFKGGWGHYNPEFPVGIGHVGIFIGDNKVINARWLRNTDGSEGGQVLEDTVESFIDRPDFVVAKRIL